MVLLMYISLSKYAIAQDKINTTVDKKKIAANIDGRVE